ncbi:hypothetical protein BEUL_1304 [Bifidobacterium eulemuris]|uniref:Uncharacterized protein n=1 Tax=Bifidobacterium eulemuris TaxID=1765219 RepID=A0A261GA31_9BIFI|nr:hypothetical protein BEUL_1304 [Bifidobacterium eulemuris]
MPRHWNGRRKRPPPRDDPVEDARRDRLWERLLCALLVLLLTLTGSYAAACLITWTVFTLST